MAKWSRLLGAACLLSMLLALTACGNGQSADGKVHIEFFQNKPEAKESFNRLIDKFNQENPDIVVTQSNPPDAETVLMTRVVKEDVPDVIGMGATDTYSVLGQSDIFADLTGEPLLDRINPRYMQMLTDLTGRKEITGIPYAANADGIMYNRAIFKKLNLEVPKTWDELLDTAQKIKDAGITPFYLTYKDDWTSNLLFNALAPNIAGIDFFLERRDDKVSFQDPVMREVAEKALAVLPFGTNDNFGRTYADGNRAFANGEAAMYIQGSWAIPEIRKANADIDLGFFATPTGDDAEANKLVSGVDTLLAVSENTPHRAESLKFVEFLLADEQISQYIKEQTAFSAVEGIDQDDPAVTELQPYFESGRLVDFADHYIPAAVQLNSMVQGFLQGGDVDAFLKRLDSEWTKVANRRS
ncbi:extracellular solute-binding protein [Saccharibacillus sp. CPCC 101409]|uniref:ABC transporter substrate-binding protein n=1 Tax=Saccharibacillus sp. CPCC 101409 TaxID=3058041 RepID=UPI002671B3E5|nr:extracellular solute-binding protein [Saccharibacillus sp. CPCC 101409]MDO3410085.1 extracellular solute-binding protein [Saccharibacillus sp. CPCC 101409]